MVNSLASTGGPSDPWLRQAADSDLVLWMAPADSADRAADQRALKALDGLTAQDARLRRIPRVVVLTRADRLDPPPEWSPPYDIEHGTRVKETHMREARQAASELLGAPLERCVLVALSLDGKPWNLDALMAAVEGALPEARQKQLDRGLRPDGWFSFLADIPRSLPSPLGRLRKVFAAWLARDR